MADGDFSKVSVFDDDGDLVIQMASDATGWETTGPFHGVIQFPTYPKSPGLNKGHGDFWVHTGFQMFAGTPDPIQYWGYNQSYNGNPIRHGEPGLSIGIEGDYNDGNTRSVEAYLQFITGTGTVFPNGAPFLRPWYWQLDRVTGRIMTSRILGNPLIIADEHANDFALMQQGRTVFTGGPDSRNLLVVEAAPGQIAQLYLTGNGQDGAFVFTSYNADVCGLTVGSKESFLFYENGAFAIGIDDSHGTFTVECKTEDSPGVSAQAHSSAQMADLFQARRADGSVAWSVAGDGMPISPSFKLAGLPPPSLAYRGARAFAIDGRKMGEGSGDGTGVPVYCDGLNWLRTSDDTPVSA